MAGPAEAALAMTKTAIKSAQLERGALLSAEVSETRAWCADLTETATGTGGHAGSARRVGADPDPARSAGTYFHAWRIDAREVQTPEQVFWNAAVLPGWQSSAPATAGAPDRDQHPERRTPAPRRWPRRIQRAAS